MSTVDAQIKDILNDVIRAIKAEEGWERRSYIQRIEMACHALVGQECVPDQGPWEASEDGRTISSDDFEHDVLLRVQGDFYSDEARAAYAKRLASQLNSTAGGLPKEPPPGLLVSMAMRYRHDFGLDAADDDGPISVGTTAKEREAILAQMRKFYDEVSGNGFFKWP